MILSIDVGIRNLAMCMFDETSNLIVQWDTSGIPPQHKDGIYVSLRKHLDEKPWILNADTVLIEKQPERNKKMVMVQHFLHAYFVIKHPSAETIIYDARHKIPDVSGSGKAQYNKRKRVSIERCSEFIHKHTVNSHWIPIFTESKKKDDLADTVMQAISYTKHIKPNRKNSKKQIKLVSRKPNENQKTSKYSKSNLAWLYKNKKEDVDIAKNKRFMKDLHRYYRTLDDFLYELEN